MADQPLRIWNSLLDNYFSAKPNVEVIAIRPFVALRSIGLECGFSAATSIGDIMEGPTSYPYKAVKHQIISTAFFRGLLLSVSLNYQFISCFFTNKTIILQFFSVE